MLNYNLKTKIHFIGVGGIGMSGIAEVLISLNYNISGSDLSDSENVQKLKKLGAEITIGHTEKAVVGATMVVVSSAINKNNPEYVYAIKEGIPILKRAEMLAELMRYKQGVAIAGTHGKTTTTSMLATILSANDIDPTYIIGGIVENLGGHAKVGSGDLLVAEADESDGTFLLLRPEIALITNIDFDHMEFYKSEENLVNAFSDFANSVSFVGVCVINGNDERLQKILVKQKKPLVTYGISEEDLQFNFVAKNIITKGRIVEYDLLIEGVNKGRVTLKTPGLHNVSNSLGALALACQMGVNPASAIEGLKQFTGVARRIQLLYKNKNVEIVDDYAHHPTEIKTIISAIREIYGDIHLTTIFEPHRYSRTKECWNDFVTSFSDTTDLKILDIYPASEKPIEGINSERLISDISKKGVEVSFISSVKEYIEKFDFDTTDKKVILTLGAGAIGREIRNSIKRIKE